MSEKKQLNEEVLEKVTGGTTAYYKKCPKCNLLSPSFIYKCSCGEDLSNITTQEFKICPNCNRPNEKTRILCTYCRSTL